MPREGAWLGQRLEEWDADGLSDAQGRRFPRFLNTDFHRLSQIFLGEVWSQGQRAEGRADKGIIMTTGTFIKDAKGEAVRDGVPPNELVNGKKLLDMLEVLRLGLRPVASYEVDIGFFQELMA